MHKRVLLDMNPLTEHDLHLRSNGNAEPITHWPVQAVRAHGDWRASVVERLMPLAIWLGFALIALVAAAGIVFFLYVAIRLVGEVFGG